MGEAARLLILDDDTQIGRTIQLIAQSAGFEARHTDDPVEFLRVVAAWQPSHVALDLVMPVMDGVEVMAQLARLKSRARVIITSGMSGRVLDAARRTAAESGLDILGTLPKPFTPAMLRTMLHGSSGATRDAARSGPKTSPAIDRVWELAPDELEAAMEAGQITVAYQPKVWCRTGALAGFEALARWRHPIHGFVSPARFIAVAETHGLIDRVTMSVLDQSLAWFGLHFPSVDGKAADVCLSINLSARLLTNDHLLETLVDRCARAGVEPTQLVWELTESSAMENPKRSLEVLTRLRMKGFKLSIDDFGTGYSSMVQLVRLPFSEIKVDRSFVVDLATSAESRSVVRSIVDLGRSLGLETTAEGVEDEAARAFLRDVGCDLAQGYYFSRPLTGDAAALWRAKTDTP